MDLTTCGLVTAIHVETYDGETHSFPEQEVKPWMVEFTFASLKISNLSTMEEYTIPLKTISGIISRAKKKLGSTDWITKCIENEWEDI